MVREGLLELDEPVGRLLPELANRRVLRRMDGPLDDTVPAEGPVTVRGLLTFTFGFGMVLEMFTAPEPWPVVAAAGKAGLATIGPPQPDDFVNPETWITRFGELPLLAQPGQRWLYNTGAHVLSVLCAELPAPPTRRCCAPGSSARSACATPASIPRTPGGWRRLTRRPQTGWWSGTRRTGSEACRQRSTTVPPGWC